MEMRSRNVGFAEWHSKIDQVFFWNHLNGEMIANVKKKFALFKNDFEILSDNANYYVEGEFLAHEFRIFNNRKLIGQISKKFLSLTDTYGVEVDDNQVLVLALAIVIDIVCHDSDR